MMGIECGASTSPIAAMTECVYVARIRNPDTNTIGTGVVIQSASCRKSVSRRAHRGKNGLSPSVDRAMAGDGRRNPGLDRDTIDIVSQPVLGRCCGWQYGSTEFLARIVGLATECVAV